MNRRELWLSALITLLAVPTHAIGVLAPTVYRDPAVLLPQNLGTDVVTLCAGIPLLLLAAVSLRGGSPRGGSPRARLLWLGALGYLVYAYAMYALGVRWNQLFLMYVTLFGLALFALILGLVGTDAGQVRASLVGRVPARSVAAYLVAIPVMVAAMWLAEELPAALSGIVPPSVVQFETPTNVVHVLDLAVVLPAMTLGAIMLLRDRPWGYVLAGMLLVKSSTIGLWVVAMIWFSARQGLVVPAPYTAFFLLLTIVGVVLAWRFTGPRAGRPEWQLSPDPRP